MIAVAIYQMVPPSPIVFFFVLGSAFARLNLLLTNQRRKRTKKIPATQAMIVREDLTSFKKDNSANFSDKVGVKLKKQSAQGIRSS